jgi:hypothetical protein
MHAPSQYVQKGGRHIACRQNAGCPRFGHYGQFILVGCGLDFVDGNDTDNGEEGACLLPTLGTSTRMVVNNVAGNGYLHSIAWAMAVQLSTREVVVPLGEAIVNQWMKRRCHIDIGCLSFGVSK